MRSLAKNVRTLVRGPTRPHEWSADISLQIYPLTQNVLQRCVPPILEQVRFGPIRSKSVSAYVDSATSICSWNRKRERGSFIAMVMVIRRYLCLIYARGTIEAIPSCREVRLTAMD